MGRGLVWNVNGPRIEGYSNFLLVLVEALFSSVGWTGILPVKLLCVGAGAALVAGLALHARRVAVAEGMRAGWISCTCAFLVATSAPFVIGSVGGLETAPFAALVGLGIAAYVRHLRGLLGGARVALVDVCLLSATLLRPEGALFWCSAALHTIVARAAKDRRIASRARMVSLAIACAVLVIYVVWHFRYFGAMLPATYVAKRPAFGPIAFVLGVRRMASFLLLDGNFIVLVVIALGLATALRQRVSCTSPLWILAFITSAYAAYVCSLGPRVPMDDAYRLHVPLVPLASLLLSSSRRPSPCRGRSLRSPSFRWSH
jgi:hypothetical protein